MKEPTSLGYFIPSKEKISELNLVLEPFKSVCLSSTEANLYSLDFVLKVLIVISDLKILLLGKRNQ